MTDDALPRQRARTRRFSAGRPKQATVTPDGRHALFLRSPAGDDPCQTLWAIDTGSGAERVLADPAKLTTDAVPADERRRRERSRELGAGITFYTLDRSGGLVTFAYAGRLWTAQVDGSGVEELPATGPVVDPRPDPTGRRIAYVASGALRTIGVDGRSDSVVAVPENADVTYGLAEFVAAEEFGRDRGHWWSPDGETLLVARVDNGPVGVRYIADPAEPGSPPVAVRYPFAGEPNAEVTLWLIGPDGSRTQVTWDSGRFEYLIGVHWDRLGLLVVVQSRSVTDLAVLEVDVSTGTTRTVREDHDDAWVPVVPGTPDRTADGALVWAVEDGDTRYLLVDGEAVTPPGLQLREVCGVDGDAVLFTASTDPTETHLYQWSHADGVTKLTDEPGVYGGTLSGGTLVVRAETMGPPSLTVRPPDRPAVRIASYTEQPVVTPAVRWLLAGDTEIRTAVLFPEGHEPGSGRLPVLLDPYGGPAVQRVTARRDQYVLSQWFANQGFAVVIADGRGTPGRGPVWDRTIHQDKAEPALEDQITALHAAAAAYPDLDLERVAMRGWSYGGFLSALAVLRRPDVIHAAIAGAPVTDQRLYDTYYQEKYLGHPDQHADVYERCSLLADAPRLSRPLMLVHGLSDDNVLVAHSLRLSSALLAAGRPHTFLPLPGVTHLTVTADVVANLNQLEVRFLREALYPPGRTSPSS
jgi:dipeptidyl-peptidase 4